MQIGPLRANLIFMKSVNEQRELYKANIGKKKKIKSNQKLTIKRELKTVTLTNRFTFIIF